MLPTKIYIAAPFSHPNIFVRLQRFYRITKYAGKLIDKNTIIYSPITHCYPMHLINTLPSHWDFWCKQDLSFLSWADKLYVLTLPGWQTSTGVNEEIKYMLDRDKPVIYVDYDV